MKAIGHEEAIHGAEQIIGFLQEVETGLPIKELCRRHGFSKTSYYLWRSKFGGMSAPYAKRLKELEAENTRLKKLLAESMLENEVTCEALRFDWTSEGRVIKCLTVVDDAKHHLPRSTR